MQLSPLQLEDLRFVHVCIEPREVPDLKDFDKVFTPYEFGNTKFTSTVEHVQAPDEEDSPMTKFIVGLTLQLPDEGDTPPPYIIDVKCIGYFTIDKGAFPDPIKRYDVGVVNGASLLYGAIREMVATTTSRLWYGKMFLPAVNFLANAPSKGDHEEYTPSKVAPAKAKPQRKAGGSNKRPS
jgi:preprotein translocase subunit SecB